MTSRALLAFGLLSALGGCGEKSRSAPSGCEASGCPPGSTCVDSACLADAPGDYRVAARFVPDEGDAVAEWSDLELLSEIGDSESPLAPTRRFLPFRFSARVTVRGSISRGGDSLPAYLQLRRRSPVDGREDALVTRAVEAGESFAITLPDVEDLPPVGPDGAPAAYELTVRSVDPEDQFPPLRLPLARAGLAVRQDLVLPETATIRGVPLRSDGEQRIANLRVVAIDPVSGRQISTVGRTSEVYQDETTGQQAGGEFRIQVPVDTDAFAIRLSDELNSANGLPTIEFTELSLPSLLVDPVDGAFIVPLSVLVLPPITGVNLSGTVEGLTRAGGRVALGQASLRFWSEDLGAPGVDDVRGTFERFVESSNPPPDEPAVYEIGLLPAGTYQVEITPPARDDLADLAIGVVEQFVNAPEPNGDQSGIVLEAPSRVAIGGTVVDAEGRPIEGARVELRGGGDRADMAAAREELWVRTATAVTSAEGAFFALVDPGRYDVVVRPLLATRLPWAIRLDLEVTEDMTLPEPIVVAPGRRLSGVVNDQEGAAVGVTVEVWCLTETDASLVCGRTTTDAAGRYELFLPAALD